jgi:ADP-L-glycero-D-manno-heptose 6-epimerase
VKLAKVTSSYGRVVVTGGAGFIGSAVVWALNLRGHDDILVVDRLDSSPKWKNLVPLRYRDYLEADDFLARIEARDDAFGPISHVVHLGACSSTTEQDAEFLLRTNYEYTKRLAARALARKSRFVYASSAATYGELDRCDDERPDVTALRPLNMYAYSKQMFDRYAEMHGFAKRIVGVKYFNVFGPNEAHKDGMRSMVAKAFDQIAAGERVQLFKSERAEFADGEQMRDFVYVKDAVAATLALAESPAAGGLYNIGSGRATTWLRLISAVFTALGRTPAIDFVPMPRKLAGAYQYSTCATLDRLRGAGFTRPIPAVEESVADYVRNYLALGKRLDPADGDAYNIN